MIILDNGSKMQQMVYKEAGDAAFGVDMFWQVTKQRVERDSNPSTIANTGIYDITLNLSMVYVVLHVPLHQMYISL